MELSLKIAEKLKCMIEKLNGKRTYLLGGLLCIISILFVLNVLPQEAFLEIVGILAGLIVLTMRSAIKKCENTYVHLKDIKDNT